MPRLPRRNGQHACELRRSEHAHSPAARAHRSGRACEAREGSLHLVHATRSRPTRALGGWSGRICACHGRSVWLLWELIKTKIPLYIVASSLIMKINNLDRVRTRISLSFQSHREKRCARRARAPTSTEDSSTVPQFLSTASQACLGIRRQEVERISSRDQRADCRARRSHPR